MVPTVSQLTEGPFDVIPKWSPDGKHIAFEAMLGLGHGRQIYVMNADGTNRWQVSEPIPQAGMFMMGVVAGWQKNLVYSGH